MRKIGQEAEKEITVHVKEKPKQELSAAKIYHGGGKVICIDAGHQARGNSSLEPNGPGSSTMKAKVTTGATGCVTGKTESQINLEVALKLQEALSNQGYTVVMCRTSQNVDLSNAQRAQMANEANADANEIRLGSMYYTKDKLTEVSNYINATLEAEKANYDNLIQSLQSNLDIVLNNTNEINGDIANMTGAAQQAAAPEEAAQTASEEDNTTVENEQDYNVYGKTEYSNDDEDDEDDDFDDDFLDD